MDKDFRIVFMGTPLFAVESLDLLLKNGFTIAGVVTTPDKPAGRGKQIQYSCIKRYALENNLHLLQPTNLKDEGFIKELQILKADLQIVVAFRMLPEIIWKMPPRGTFNLHASLLPQYRGCSPINRVIMNGETETGVTTFFINEKIDAGNIILTSKINISPDETAGELHNKLMKLGAELVIKTLNTIKNNDYKIIEQSSLYNHNTQIKYAPKINKIDCIINWNDSVMNIYNFIRGLSPKPTAYTELISPDKKKYYIKIFRTAIEKKEHHYETGTVITDNKTYLSIAVSDGLIHLHEIQLSCKNKMPVCEFLKGFKLDNNWKV